MKTMIKFWTGLAAVALVAVGAVVWYGNRNGSTASVKETRMKEIREMVNLCTLEIMDEVALKDSINGKWLFARCRLNGRVGFDLEKLEFREKGDTLVVVLPPETVEIRESVSPGSYEVIDTWDDSLLGLGKLSTAEENALRRRQAARYRTMVYSRGYVSRARANAVATLTDLFSLFDTPVVIFDPSPEGEGWPGTTL